MPPFKIILASIKVYHFFPLSPTGKTAKKKDASPCIFCRRPALSVYRKFMGVKTAV